PFRAKQIYSWLHQKGATSFEEMTDLSKALREKLAARAGLVGVEVDLEQRSVDGTIKYRWRTHDGHFIESVYMPSPDRRTLCVSSQVGCAMKCGFCMTGTMGIKRNQIGRASCRGRAQISVCPATARKKRAGECAVN